MAVSEILGNVLMPLVALVGVTSVAATAMSHASVHFKLWRRRRPGPHAPPISILKPLKGLDDGLQENLASLAQQDYPGSFELILGAADPADPAMEVAVALRKRFPQITIKTVCGRPRPGLNPKVANLIALAEVAEHDAILISDSNVRVGPTYLKEISRELADPRVGLVSNVLAGVGAKSFGATLENLHLNSFVAGAVCGADVMARHPVVIGKSMLMRRRDLDRLGGFARVADVLGEDYLLGAAFARAGYKVVLSPHVIRTINVSWGVRRFLSRHLRWSQMRRWIAPRAYAFEPLLHPLPWLMVLAALLWMRPAGAGVPAATWGWLGAATTTKIASDAWLSRRLSGRWPSLLGLLSIPVKDTLVLALWCVAWGARTVSWRGNKLRIHGGSRLSALPAATDSVIASSAQG